jgi:prepilin-type processing-associated H-X9-DG protein
MGTMQAGPSWTNTALIQVSLLYPYSQSVAIYRCPADRSTADATYHPYGPGGTPRMRSMSMNGWLNTIPGSEMSPDGPGVTNFRKLNSITKPSDTFVFLDENPGSIDDGWFASSPTQSNWENAPATYHNNANGISFADGHSLIKKWNDPGILGPNVGLNAQPKDGGVDLRWLNARGTY